MKIKLKNVYLDVCTLSRPFDEQDYLRIHMETEAVNLILSNIKEGIYKLIVSPVHIKEIEAIPDVFERIELQTILKRLGESVNVNMSVIRNRAEELIKFNFGIADALHVAFAEHSADYFISCDDILVKKCSYYKVNIWCGNPVIFCEKEGLK